MTDQMMNTAQENMLVEKGKTTQLDTGNLSIDVHSQYLDNLYRHYNIQVNHALLFYLQSQTDPVIFVDKRKINVGRQDSMGRIRPEFDLGLHNGAELGVSRLHAKIVFDNGRYLIQDLHSTNRTWINGSKLVPYQYYEVPDGAVIQFGKLISNAYVITRD